MKKGYKITNIKREKKIGVAAENLEELITKSSKKLSFNVSCAQCRLFVAEDGTQVEDDEYLATLPSQTLFILVNTNTEKMVTDFDFYYDLIRSHKKDFIDTGAAAKEFLSTNIKEKFKVFQKYIGATDDARTMLSERTQDPGWFEGLELSEKNKEQSMSKRVKDRMRGYYYKTKSALQSSDFYTHSKNRRDSNVETSRLTGRTELLGMDEEHQAGSSGLRSMARSPDTDDVPPPHNMSPSITRSTKRLSSNSEDLEPAKKKPKNTSTVEEDNIRTELEKIHETQVSVMKLIRDLTDKQDCVKTLVATKMNDIEMKISTMNDRLGALQTARRDGFRTSVPQWSTASTASGFRRNSTRTLSLFTYPE